MRMKRYCMCFKYCGFLIRSSRCWSFLKKCLSSVINVKNMVNRNLLALYAITFLLILPFICFSMKNSLCFLRYDENGVKQILRKENSRRIKEAQRYFEMLNETKFNAMLHSFSNGQRSAGTLTIVIMIITVSRNRHKIDEYEPMYLTQAVWKFLTQLHSIKTKGFLHRVTLGVCNVDHDPETYEEAKSISHFVPVFQRFNETFISEVHILEKEKQDYVFCLNRSLESNPDYVLLVEDDAQPTPDFFRVLDYTLTMHLNRRLIRGELIPQFENIAYVKFFHPESMLSFWNLEIDRILELIALTMFLGINLTGIFLFTVKDKDANVLAAAIGIFMYSFLVVSIIGRPNFTNLRSILSPYLHTFTPAPSCCTQALLFPVEGAVQVISYLDKITCYYSFAKDSGLDRLLSERKLNAYLVQPNTFIHVGIYSSLRDNNVNPFVI